MSGRIAHRRLSYAFLGAVVVAATVALATYCSPASAAAPCTDVELIGLRGSGEPLDPSQHDMGALIGPVANAVANQLSAGATVGFYGLPYPAGDATPVTFLSRSYFRSKDQGVTDLRGYLTSRIAECPASQLVVMGYSQGAHAGGDMLAGAGRDITDHVAALVMFGDPRFNPDADYALGTFDPSSHGLAGVRSLSDFAGDQMRVFSFCNQRDPVCQGADKWLLYGDGAHSQTSYVYDYESLAGGLVRRALGYTAPSRVPVDLAFVIDSTGSMSGAIAGVESAAQEMVDTLDNQGTDFRVGLVDYKDTDQGDPYAARVDLPMTDEASAFRDSVAALEADGGGDYEEAVYSGLMTAYDELDWRMGARKAIILMGDAPAKDPEPITGFTQQSVIAAANGTSGGSPKRRAAAASLDVTSLYTLPIGGSAASSFEPLSSGTGGRMFEANDPSLVADEMLAAVDAAAAPILATLAAPESIRTGSPVPLVAAGHYEHGDVVGYEWDFDDDGTVDLSTAGGHVVHTFPEPYEGDVVVTVRTDDGYSAKARRTVSVRDDAPVAPGSPAVTATAGGPSVWVEWTEPTDLGGGSVTGYAVEIVSATSGEPVASTVVPSFLRGYGFGDLDEGSYVARVSAATEAGLGPAGTAPFSTQVPLGPPGSTGTVVPRHPAVGATLSRIRWRGRRLRLDMRCPTRAASACVVRAALTRRARRLTSGRITLAPGRVGILRLSSLSKRQLALARRGRSRLRLTLRTTTAAGSVSASRYVKRPPQ